MSTPRVRWPAAIPGLLLGALLAAACATNGPSSSPSPPPTPPPTPLPTPEPTLPAEPPAAVLSVRGGAPVAGQLGSWILLDHGADSPWLPGTPILVPPGAVGRVQVAEPLPIASWTARVAAVGRTPDLGETIAIGEGAGEPIEVELPPGPWTLQVSIWFADGVGDATYYWRLSQD